MKKDKSELKDKHQQLVGDGEIKKHIKQDLIDLANKLKILAARFETCGFMPSINQYATLIGWKASELYADIAVNTRSGEKGESHGSLKSSDDLSLKEIYAKDLLQRVHALTEKTYLRNADPKQASIKMMKVADLIQEDLIDKKKMAIKIRVAKLLRKLIKRGR